MDEDGKAGDVYTVGKIQNELLYNSDEVVATDEVAVLKELVLCVADLLEAGVYSGGVQLDNLLSEAGLDALSQTFEAMYHSTAVYELKDWGLDILKPQLPHSVYNMVAEATAEELRHDTHEAAIIFSYLADSHFYQDGHIHLEVGGPAALAAAIKEMTNLDIMDGHEAEIFKLLIDRVGLAKLDSSLDPIANVESAIENEDWSWDKEFYALADLVASLDGILASGTMLEENGSIKFENLLECNDVAALTATLKAFNHVRSLRSMILTVVDENLGSMASGSFDVTEFFSDSFKDQLDSKEMADVAYWDAEMESLAKIVVKVDALNTDVNTMTEADVDVLVDVLHIMNNSELFVVDPIASILEEQLEDYNVTLGDTSSWDEAKWDEEIDNIGDLLKEIISVDSLDANAIKNMAKADLIDLLTAMNHSELTRVALPKVIDEAVKSALQSNTTVAYADLVDAWLTNQVNGTMEDEATWDAEILVLADIITAIKDDSIFDVENATSYDAIEGLLFDIKDSKSFKLAFLTKLMSSSLEPLVGTASLGSMGDDSDPRWGNETEGEIVDIIAVLEAAKAIDAFAGTFDITAKSEAQIKDLLTAMNHSIVLRNTLPVVLFDAINDNEPSLVSAWLASEHTAVKDSDPATNMSSEAVWDAEIAELAKVVATVATVDVINMSTVELSSLLHTINKSKSLEIEGIYDLLSTVQSQMDITTLGKVEYTLGDEVAKFNAWEAEIDNLVKVVELAKAEGIVGGTTNVSVSDAINSNTKVENDELLKAINASSILRVVLPKAIKEACDTFGTDEYLTDWINSQNEAAMKSVAEWDSEIEKLTSVVELLNNNNGVFDRFTGNTFTDSDIYVIKQILSQMNATQMFTLNPMVDVMQETLDGILPANSNVELAANLSKAEWSIELDILFGEYNAQGAKTAEGIITIMNNLGNITFEQLRDNSSIGQMLDLMTESYVFGPDFNDIVRAIIKDTTLYTSTDPVLLTDTELSDERLNKVSDSLGGWTQELATLTSIDLDAAEQGGAVLDTLSESILLETRFVPLLQDLVWEIITTNDLDGYISQSNSNDAVEQVNDRIETSKETPDPSDDWSWAQEVDQIKELTVIITDLTTAGSYSEVLAATAELKALYDEVKGTTSIVAILVEGFAAEQGIPLE